MKSCGVIVEYNPFHNGHQYHLQKAREVSGADVIVAIMSGNFLQRGEPAIVDKWQRAKAALENGADLVIELPVAYAVQSADYFATGSVKLLQALGVTALCFGTDGEGSLDYQAFGEFHHRHQVEIDLAFQALKNKGMNYPQQMSAVYRQLYPEWQLDLKSPNHILGMSYAKANQAYPDPLTLYPIQREGAHHHDSQLEGTAFASGTAIRQAVFKEDFEQVRQVVPLGTWQQLTTKSLLSWETAWPFLKYQLLSTSLADLAQTYQISEGLEYRLKAAVLQAQSFTEFVDKVKTKRYTWTRIQRLCTYCLLQMTATEVNQVWQQSYLRVLGFTDAGRNFLKEQRSQLTLPLVTNISQQNKALVSLDVKAGQLYQLLQQELIEQDYYRKPLYVK